MASDIPSYPLEVPEHTRSSRLRPLIWLVAFVALCGWVVWRLGGFHLDEVVRQYNANFLAGYIAVDHPFHTMRAWQLIESLRDGEILRWITTHQGGYPVEFYPLGVSWIEAGTWALTFGQLSIFTVHKLVTIGMFLLPGLGFWFLARGDQRSPASAFIALTMQVAIAGYWMAGGFTELVLWGLITNVAGATAALIAIGPLARFSISGERKMAVIAILAIGAATYTNPRSLIAVAVVGLAVGCCLIVFHRPDWRAGLLRLGTVAGISGLLGASEILSLIRYRDLYYFVNYEQYDASATYWMGSVRAVSTPVIWLAVLGAVWALVSPRFPVARMASVALGFYVLVTLFLSGAIIDVDFIQQLEAPRLMPFQRMLTLFMAAFFIARLIDVLATLFRVGWGRDLGALAIGLVILVVFIRPLGDIGADFRGMPEVPKISMNELDTFREAISTADAAAPAGTAILVLGTSGPDMSWHERLWASLETRKPLYYEHWLWGWNDQHQGPDSQGIPGCTFNNDAGNYYPCPDLTLSPGYFAAHGIGAVVVTNVGSHANTQDARDAAQASPLLQPIGTFGVWDAYSVVEPVALIVDGNQEPVSVMIEDQHMSADFTDGPGDILVKVNWFPRWSATVNGESAEIERAEGGYMRIVAPPGPVELKLTYELTMLDWFNRFLAVIGFCLTACVALGWPRSAFARISPR